MVLLKPRLLLKLLTIIAIISQCISKPNKIHAEELEDDVLCLSSIKQSLEDPHNYLGSWKFNNQSTNPGFICTFTGVECWNSLENRVININLRSLGLKGKFPNGISKCKSLVSLDLSHNKFYGSIPANISTMLPFLVTFSVSSNEFSGEIPGSLGNCSYLNVLELDGNRFSGRIPKEIGRLRRIKRFTVADNLLVGEVPRFDSGISFNESSYADNPGLCGYPLNPCSYS